jgi:hypothetical protein
LGYAIWGPKAPRGSTTAAPLAITPVKSIVAPDGTNVPNGIRRITPLEKITEDKATLTLTLEDEGLDDNAIVRIDDGKVNVIGTDIFRGGEFAGFQPFTNAVYYVLRWTFIDSSNESTAMYQKTEKDFKCRKRGGRILQ